jgi:hypothetical protein
LLLLGLIYIPANKALLPLLEFVEKPTHLIKSTTMSLKNSFKREDLFWYVTVWNLFIISLPNAIQNKKIGLWILLGNLFLIAGICIYVVLYNKRNNIKLRKGSLPFLLIVFGFLVFVLWASGTLGRMFAPH